MDQISLVAIGASAGGIQALMSIVRHLPSKLCAAVMVVIHTRAEATSYLDRILRRETLLPVSFAHHGASIESGRIYVAPPDLHLVVRNKTMELTHGPKENGFRPAVDPLFRSAARVYGSRVMGVILSGGLDDGAYGLRMIKDAGGIAVVQDPNEATHPGMPLNAMEFVTVDHVLPSTDIGHLIADRCGVPDGAAKGDERMARRREPDPQNRFEETDVAEMEQEFGPPSGLTCPDCGGALWERHNGALARYRCHVGHQFTTEGLDAEQSKAVEGALWSAVRVLEEHAELRKRMAQRAEDAGMTHVASGFSDSARESERQAHTIRELLFTRPAAAPPRSSPRPRVQRRAKKAKTARRVR